MLTSIFNSSLTVFINKFNKNKIVALNAMGEYGKEKIQGETPVLSGDLKKSVGYKVENEDLYFFSLLPYAPYVEFGTFVMNANPFMKRGMYKSHAGFIGIMIKNFKV